MTDTLSNQTQRQEAIAAILLTANVMSALADKGERFDHQFDLYAVVLAELVAELGREKN